MSAANRAAELLGRLPVQIVHPVGVDVEGYGRRRVAVALWNDLGRRPRFDRERDPHVSQIVKSNRRYLRAKPYRLDPAVGEKVRVDDQSTSTEPTLRPIPMDGATFDHS
jgi:hypothetical protein